MTHHASRHTPYVEWIALVALLLLAAAFRLIALGTVPPGLHHDEVIIGQVAKDILNGRLAIYFPEGYGHEPLYHYIAAGLFAIGGANEFTLRLTTALLGLLTVAAVYRLARALFGPGVALMTMAWMAVSLWPVFYSRVGLRNLTLPLMISLTAWMLWLNVKRQTPNVKRWAAAGMVFGLTFYTYQGSRVFPLVFLIWVAYLAICHRAVFVRNWRGLVLFSIVAALVAAPLAYYLTIVNPQAEARVGNLMGPLQALLAGDPTQVLQLATATAGMFTIKGDEVWLYNVSGRPVFPEPVGGTLFYLGLLMTLWRWREPKYALLLLWLPISLTPAAVTWPAPNLVRALGALPVVFMFPSIAIQSLANVGGAWVERRTKGRGWPSMALAMMALLAWNAGLTARDYFAVWPRHPQVRWLYQATWTQAAHWLDANPDPTPVAASGLKIHDLDPQTYDLLLRRRDLKVKWFDCRTSVLLPGQGAMRYISPDFFPCDADLWARFLGQAQVVVQPRWPDTHEVIFTGHRLGDSTGFKNSTDVATFGPLSLLGLEITRPMVERGQEAELLTFWRVRTCVPVPIAIFVHVVGGDGRPLAQWDGFDFGEAQLESGDQLVERHRFMISTDLVPGRYHVLVGLYDPATRRRFTLPDGTDHLVAGSMMVQ